METPMDYRILIAGLTRLQDVALALELGATDIGCEMIPESSRCVTPERAKELFQVADPSVGKFLLFRSSPAETVIAAAMAAEAAFARLLQRCYATPAGARSRPARQYLKRVV